MPAAGQPARRADGLHHQDADDDSRSLEGVRPHGSD